MTSANSQTLPKGDAIHFAEVLGAEKSKAKCRPPGSSVGLAFSGGGIRSATFNLGVIQALAERRLLQCFDYLSTVSGGGYIGSWLSSLIHRRAKGDVKEAEELINGEQPLPSPRPAGAPKCSGSDAIKEDEAIRWLRAYGNYITPRLGLLGGDAQAAISTWLRNFLLNLTVLTAMLATALLIPRVLQRTGAWLAERLGVAEAYEAWGLLLLAVPCLLVVGLNLIRETPAAASRDARLWYTRGWALRLLVILPIMVLAWLGAEYLMLLAKGGYARWQAWPDLRVWMTFSACGYVALWLIAWLVAWLIAFSERLSKNLKAHPAESNKGPTAKKLMGEGREKVDRFRRWCGWLLKFLVFAGIAGMLGGRLLKWAAEGLAHFAGPEGPWLVFVLGPPLFIIVVLTVVTVHIGLMARGFSDQQHEFWSRIGGQLQVMILVWLVVAGLAAFSTPVVEFLAKWAVAWAAGGGIIWLGTSLAGVMFGKSAATNGDGTKGWRDAVARVAPYVFVVGFLCLLAWGVQKAYTAYGESKQWYANRPCAAPAAETGGEAGIYLRAPNDSGATVTTAKAIVEPSAWEKLAGQVRYEIWLMNRVPIEALLTVFGILVGLTVLLAWRINVNLYSIHKFYRNRLVRCYLGATNVNRRPSPVTGFDPRDDIELKESVQKPYHIINTAINLTSGRQLAWQRRKAASYTFTPLYTGYEPASPDLPAGYRPTDSYAVDNATGASVCLGTTVAASGAAASPNQGFHTDPAVAFLLTVFDVRLGRWCGDTAHASAWKKADPTWSLLYWIAELMGLADTNLPFVYLSDGGHFENLGIYELVRRRCRVIVACDGSADPGYVFDDLGEAIRKCYIDFGVEITIDVNKIVPSPDAKTGRSQRHYAVGEIHYERARDPSPMGQLVYIKASVTPHLPTDLWHYKSENPEFPHQSTADQFFDETQFESYRKLGYQAAMDSIADMGTHGTLPPELARQTGLAP